MTTTIVCGLRSVETYIDGRLTRVRFYDPASSPPRCYAELVIAE